MPAREVEIQKIHDRAVGDAVDDVAEGAAHDEGEGGVLQFLFGLPPEHVQNPAGNGEGEDNEQPFLPAARAGEQAESGAGVVHQHEIEKAGQRQAFAQREMGEYGELAGLVCHDHEGGDGEPEQKQARRVTHAAAPRLRHAGC